MGIKIKPNVPNIMNSRSLELFESAIKSPESRKIYMYSLHEFMKFAKIQDYDEITKLDTEKIQKILQNWVIHLAKKELKAHTIRGKLAAIVLFLEMNRVVFHKKIIHKLIPSDDYVPGGEIPFTTEEIQRMLNSTTKLRTKALVNFLASTGVRPASIIDPVLRLEHVENMPNNCKSVKIYDGSKEGYFAFLTPEASLALNQYLSSRKLNGEQLNPKSPVFANYDKPNPTMKYNYMSTKSLRHLLQNLIKASGIERIKKGSRFDKAPVYGFRKRFFTILKLNNNVNPNIAEKLMGHKRGYDGSYLKPTREQCFAEFVKTIPELTLSDEERLKAENQKLQEEKSEIEIVKYELRKLQNDYYKNLFTPWKVSSDEITKLKEGIYHQAETSPSVASLLKKLNS
jgi:integrase/recombinase XerD